MSSKIWMTSQRIRGLSRKMKENDLLQVFVLIVLFILFSFIFPSLEGLLHPAFILVLLIMASFHDIRSNEIPLTLCLGIFFINSFHTILYSHHFAIWIPGLLTSTIMLALHFLNRKMIGLGDVVILGLCVSALFFEDVLGFLFLSFFFCSTYGIVLGISRKNIKERKVPLTPCITLAFMMHRFVL